jgi:hypothetical protein
VLGVAARDVDEEVDRTAEAVDRDGLGQRAEVVADVLKRLADVKPQLDRDQRLESETERVRPQPRGVARDHVRLEPAHAREARRRREPDLCGQLLVGDPCIVLQRRQQRAIDSVEARILDFLPNSIRCRLRGLSRIL